VMLVDPDGCETSTAELTPYDENVIRYGVLFETGIDIKENTIHGWSFIDKSSNEYKAWSEMVLSPNLYKFKSGGTVNTDPYTGEKFLTFTESFMGGYIDKSNRIVVSQLLNVSTMEKVSEYTWGGTISEQMGHVALEMNQASKYIAQGLNLSRNDLYELSCSYARKNDRLGPIGYKPRYDGNNFIHWVISRKLWIFTIKTMIK